jgi:predicted  nucleic acid-binding Zn-ribbon protein
MSGRQTRQLPFGPQAVNPANALRERIRRLEERLQQIMSEEQAAQARAVAARNKAQRYRQLINRGYRLATGAMTQLNQERARTIPPQ